ncbi:hypothetical protein [Streptomyces sp. NPDC059008]|uniref:hypothetical protein n=1 Tax=Streptomyces sp. NPDC059008 TaxID=3346693 RepID=UPI0036C87007
MLFSIGASGSLSIFLINAMFLTLYTVIERIVVGAEEHFSALHHRLPRGAVHHRADPTGNATQRTPQGESAGHAPFHGLTTPQEPEPIEGSRTAIAKSGTQKIFLPSLGTIVTTRRGPILDPVS